MPIIMEETDSNFPRPNSTRSRSFFLSKIKIGGWKENATAGTALAITNVVTRPALGPGSIYSEQWAFKHRYGSRRWHVTCMTKTKTWLRGVAFIPFIFVCFLYSYLSYVQSTFTRCVANIFCVPVDLSFFDDNYFVFFCCVFRIPPPPCALPWA